MNILPSDKISTKRLLMQYARLLPYKLGLVNEAVFLHQIKQIYPDDIFLVSFPKSGNTWLRYIIAYIKYGVDADFSLNDLQSIVPDIYRLKDFIDKMERPRIIKSHDVFLKAYPKIIYIFRDYLDVLISYFHYQKNLSEFDGTFEAYVKEGVYNKAFGSWKSHVKAALKFKTDFPERIMIIKYENLKLNFNDEVKNIIGFTRLNGKVDLNLLHEKVKFNNLREKENSNGSIMKNVSGNNFFRKGGSNVKSEYYNETLLKYVFSDTELLDLYQSLGYNISIS